MPELRTDEGALYIWLNDPNGPVQMEMERLGLLIESGAKINATGREYGDGSRGPRVRTGRLRSSIQSVPAYDDEGVLGVEVGTDVFYGRILEVEGVGPLLRRYPFLGPTRELLPDGVIFTGPQ